MTQEQDQLKAHTNRTLGIAALLLVGWLLVRAIRSRTLVDFLTYPSYIAAVLIGATTVFIIGRNLIVERTIRLNRKTVSELLAALAGNCFLAVVYYSTYVGLSDFVSWLRRSTWTKEDDLPAVLATTIALSFVLFLFRLRLRFLYGISEALAGLAVVSHQILSSNVTVLEQNAGFFLAVLTAGVYLLVRGMDNVHQALTKPPLDPIANAVAEAFAPETDTEQSKPEQQG